MFLPRVFLCFCLIVCCAYGEVELKKGVNETITFDGDNLIIVVDNTMGRGEGLQLCFGSSSDQSYPPCLPGFARSTLEVAGNSKRQLKINRKGQLLKEDGSTVDMLGAMKFNEDGTLNIMVGKLPDDKTKVTLPNAEIFVPPAPEDNETTNKESHAATANLLIIIVVVAVGGFIVVIIGILVWFCILRKPKRTQVTDRQGEVPFQQRTPHKPSKTKKPSSKNPTISKSTTTTASHLPVSPKRPIKPPVTATKLENQSSLTAKSKHASKSIANNQKTNDSASSQESQQLHKDHIKTVSLR